MSFCFCFENCWRHGYGRDVALPTRRLHERAEARPASDGGIPYNRTFNSHILINLSNLVGLLLFCRCPFCVPGAWLEAPLYRRHSIDNRAQLVASGQPIPAVPWRVCGQFYLFI